MRSTSSEGVVVRDVPVEATTATNHATDLRTGAWTRLGSGSALGDTVTETLLSGLAQESYRAARAQGYATGWAEGRRVALARAAAEAEAARALAEQQAARHRAEHAQCLQALHAAAEQMQRALAAAVEEVGTQAVEVALELTEAILGREVATTADPGGDAVRRALGLVDPHVTMTVRLHPEDRAALDPRHLTGRDVNVVADPTLARGDAMVETEGNVVDATIGTALARVREVLAQ
jgi:flagellar assembly protein FliH